MLASRQVMALDWLGLVRELDWKRTLATAIRPEAIRLSGYVQNDTRRITTGGPRAEIANGSSIRLTGSTFLWQPWIAQLSAGVGFSYSIQHGELSQDNKTITGDTDLRLFPQSRFPFNAFFETTNNAVNGEFVGPSRSLTRYGVNQMYSTLGPIKWFERSRFRASYDHTIASADDLVGIDSGSLRDTADALTFSVDTSVGEHNLDLTNDIDRVKRENPDEINKRLLSVLRHEYRPDTSLSVNNLLSYNDFVTQRSASERSTSLLQLSSNAFWRPETEKMLQVVGTALFQERETTFGDSSVGASRNGNMQGQANYQITPYTSIRGQLGVAVADNPSDTIFLSTQRAGVDYSPAERPLLGMDYAYTLAADIANRAGTDGPSVQNLNLNIGHVFSRSMRFGGGMGTFSATERGFTVFSNPGKASRNLTHSLTTSWSRSAARTSLILQMMANDTRRIGGSSSFGGGLQMVNFQATGKYQVTRYSSLHGNVTFQVIRPLEEREGDAMSVNTSVDIAYSHSRLFGVDRLTFLSEFRHMSNSLIELVQSRNFDLSQDLEDSYWRNRIEYPIGRMHIRAGANLGRTNTTLNTLLYLQLRRSF